MFGLQQLQYVDGLDMLSGAMFLFKIKVHSYLLIDCVPKVNLKVV